MNKLADILRAVGKKNSIGGQDSEIAHVNPQEIAILKLLGGSGRRDPQTGLRHFDVGDNETESGDSYGDGAGYSSDQSGQGGPSDSPSGWGEPDTETAPGQGFGLFDEPNGFQSPSEDVDALGDPIGDPGLSGGYGSPGGGMAGFNEGLGPDSGGSDSSYDEQSIGTANSGRMGNTGGLGTQGVNAASQAYGANPAGWNNANNTWSDPVASAAMQGPDQGPLTDLSNWASREGIYSAPGAGQRGALDAFGTNFGDPHSLNANGLQSFLTQNGIQSLAQIGVPALATVLGGPLAGAATSLAFNGLRGENITSQGLSLAGGLLGGPVGSTAGTVVGNFLEGNPQNALNMAINAGLNYGGVNLGATAGKNVGNPGSIENTLASIAGQQGQNALTDYASSALMDAYSNPGMVGGFDANSPAYADASMSGGDSSFSEGGFDTASIDSPSFSVAGGGGGPGDMSNYFDFIGSKKKSRYRQPNPLMAMLGGEYAA